jgi:hypothetical protein
MYVFPRKFSRTIARETQIPDHHDAPVGERDNHPRPAPAGPSAGNGLQGLARVARAWHPRRPLVAYESGADLAAARQVSLRRSDASLSGAVPSMALGDGPASTDRVERAVA